jgi:hypothetical protein
MRIIFEFLKLICLGHDASTYVKQTIYFIAFFSVCFETDLFVSVVSILIRNTETPKQTEKIIYWFCETNRKTTETG